MSQYNLEAKYMLLHSINKMDDAVIDQLWELFQQIFIHWEDPVDPGPMKPDFIVFLSNRIETDPRYLLEYLNCCEVIKEMIGELEAAAAYQKMFTDPEASLVPPVSKLARARQLVVNEFISLYLALGGFSIFGDPSVADGIPKNYPGYIGGMNIENKPPYRIPAK